MKVYNSISSYELCDGLKDLLKDFRQARHFDVEKYIEDKAKLLNKYMSVSGLDTCVVAVSGGIDSAVVLSLVTQASKLQDSPIKKILPMLLPCYDSEGVTNQDKATDRGIELCKSLNLEPVCVIMSDIMKKIRDSVVSATKLQSDDWAEGQLVPYSRTPVLYYTTSLCTVNNLHAMIVGTTNFSEGGYLGYVGKASDGMVDVQLISDIYKSEVYQVADKLGVPSSIINATPTGDMFDNRSDIEVFGASYDFVELYQEYLRVTEYTQRGIFEKLRELGGGTLEQFLSLSANLENLHRYNAHKYLCGSPAVHLDLWTSNVPNGWNNKRWRYE